MRFKGTASLLAIFVLLGGYVYFTEYRGRDEREQEKAAAKKAVHFEAKDVTELTLKQENSVIKGSKTGERQWAIKNPAGIEADPDEWDRLAQSISDIQREDSLAANASDLAAFGLDKPVLEVDVKLSDGRSTQIQFGSENPRKTL